MHKIVFILLFNLTRISLNAQNLVPNPSFEDTVSCPTFASQIDMAVGWLSCRNSPDYFHECDWLTGVQSVPNNNIGFQYAQDGKAYAGFITYSRNGINYREHLICSLISPLQVNKKYSISYFISLGNNYSGLSTNNQGVLFSTVYYSQINWSPICNYSHANSNLIQSDTLNWIHVNGSFIADSAYTYMIIGNFYDDQNTDTIYNPPASHSYYFLDNILVEEDTTTNINEFANINHSIIFPNPVNDILKIESKKSQMQNVEIIDMYGKSIFLFMNKENLENIQLDFEKFGSGFYFVKINYFDKSSSFQKLYKY